MPNKPLLLFLGMICVRLRRLSEAAYGFGRGVGLGSNEERRGRPRPRPRPRAIPHGCSTARGGACLSELCEELSALSIL